MAFYDLEVHTGQTFAERIGEPQEFEAALGQVVESFSFLEDSLCQVITMFLGTNQQFGEIVTAELSFRLRVNMLVSLFKYKNSLGDFAVTGEDCAARVKELASLCFAAEQRRNEIVHSSYVLRRYRIKKTAKSDKGLRTTITEVDANHLLDVADYIAEIGAYVQQLPLHLNMADRATSGATIVQYFREGVPVATFAIDIEVYRK